VSQQQGVDHEYMPAEEDDPDDTIGAGLLEMQVKQEPKRQRRNRE
jgi:hypothetical protein